MVQWGKGFIDSMLYARLCGFSFLILQSLSKMGMIVPILQIWEQNAQDSTFRDVAASECKPSPPPTPLFLASHNSALPLLRWEKGVSRGRVCKNRKVRLKHQRLQCPLVHLDGAQGSASRTHLGLQPTSLVNRLLVLCNKLW